jgi:hypothetical protein
MRRDVMPPIAPNVDTGFRKYAELLLRRHSHLMDGRADDPETEKIDEDLSALWEQLDESQRRSLSGMGSDLNWVGRQGALAPKARSAEVVTAEDRRLLAEAEAQKDWHATLHYLRVCAPVLAIDDVARRRAAAYVGIGLPAYADACRTIAGRRGPTCPDQLDGAARI